MTTEAKLTNTMPLQIAQAILAFAGSAVAGTLWWAHRMNVDLPCTKGGGCTEVANSRYAHVDLFGLQVPVALLGLLAYLAALALSMSKIASDSRASIRKLNNLLLALTTFGAGYSWYLQWIVHLKLGTYCVWCRSSAWIMSALFALTVWEQVILILDARRTAGPDKAPALAPASLELNKDGS